MTKTILLFFLTFATWAQSFTMEHPTCVVRFKGLENESRMNELASSLLEGKRFKVGSFLEGTRVYPGETYFEYTIFKPKEKLYTACEVTILLKKSKNNFPSKSDEILLKKTVKRRVPRITISGSERCRMALEDTFVHVPYCKKN